MHRKSRSVFTLCLLPTAMVGCFDVVDKVEPSTRVSVPATVNPVSTNNNPPNISGSPSANATIGRTWSFTPSASDPDGDSITFTIANSPRCASFDSSSGQLSGLPLLGDQGEYSDIRISVSDGQSSTTLPSFAVSVQSVTVNGGPSIFGNPATNASVGESYNFTPTGSDPENDTLSFSIANRPTWALFDSDTGQLSGTPFLGDAGLHTNIVISVSDGQQAASLAPFSINVLNNSVPNRPPLISGAPPLFAMIDQLYSFQPTASDPDGDSLIFTISNPPAWAAFDTNTGLLSGTPVAGEEGIYEDIQIFVGDGQATTALPEFSITVDDPNSNDAPTISGLPPPLATVDQFYSFLPSAADVDGDSLSFSISNQPSWTTFDTDTGELSGTPASGDEAVYDLIEITVSDGNLSTSLAPFSITVSQAATGSVTLTWTAPTTNTDGSALTDLAGYRIYYGTSPGTYPNEVPVNNPGLTTFVIDNLVPDTYYFVSTSVNEANIESVYSNEATKTVN